MARHQYKAPPVVEAICQIQLLPSGWLEFPQLARLRQSFSKMFEPGKPKEQESVESELAGGFLADGTSEIQAKYKIVRKTLFPSEDGTRFVAVSLNELSVHTLAPYDGWDPFRERIAEVLNVCRDPELAAQLTV